MAHLGTDVAAFVDGQLEPAAMRDARTHLEGCESCGQAVRQQRAIKSRMETGTVPEPPRGLLASLNGLADQQSVEEGRWVRLRRAAPLRAGVALAGASMAVAALAYAVGGGAAGVGDRVAPPFDDYASGFFGASSSATAVSVSEGRVAELNEQGWACHGRLAGDLERTHAALTRADDAIALTYSNGTTRMKVYEQAGRLDPAALEGFEQQIWGSAVVWHRVGEPTLVTWDRDGIVYTIVTDADPQRIRGAVAQLPTSESTGHPLDRLGRGVDRMTSWAAA
ncbi:anti-sigma factor family protein [Aeromicrobium sp. CF3.5]|uniref:anti-sigma factor family protein n=1 Tax=Aeromicrobium sp. CF3.5 TaxID=3373078 RepID=UPI003EE67BC0